MVVHPILVRADWAGATHRFVEALARANFEYSIGFGSLVLCVTASSWPKKTTGSEQWSAREAFVTAHRWSS